METAKKTPEIVHESEAQRQYVRLALPAYAEIAGSRYTVKDISTGGMGVTGVEGNFAAGQILATRLVLPFVDFTLEVSVDIQVQHFERENKFLGCRFVNLSANQVSILNHVIKAFIAGDVVSAGDLLSVTGRDNFVKVRKARAGAQSAGISIARQLPGILLITALGLAAAGLIFSNIYNRLFVLKSSQGVLVGPVVEVKAESEGTLKFLVSTDTVTVKPGQPLAAIVGTPAANALPGASQPPGYVIKSPCECFLSRNKAQSGEFLAVGTPVLTLIPVTAEPIVTVALEPQHGSRVPLNGEALVTVAGIDGKIPGRVLSVESNLPAILASAASANAEGAAVPAVVVKIRPDQKLPADLIGRPASAEFRTY